MRHHSTKRKFGRVRKQRKALLASLAVSLVRDERIKTTEAKAKELRPFIEKLVTKSRHGNLASVRLLTSRLDNNKSAAQKLASEIASRYILRKGGYTRIIKLPPRASDGSKMAVIEFV